MAKNKPFWLHNTKASTFRAVDSALFGSPSLKHVEMSDNDRQLRNTNNTNKQQSSGKDMSVNELANLMKSQFSTFQRTTRDDIKVLGEKLSSEMDKLREELTIDIEQLRNESKRTCDELTSTIRNIKTKTTQALEITTRTNDLIISGVPFVQGEDLPSYFKSWCHSLGYSENCLPMVDIRRLKGRNAEASRSPVIMIQFAIAMQRNDFYSHYLRTRSLKLSDIGFSVNKRIYVNENLGPVARQLRSRALQLKKDGKLQSVYTRRGTIYVRRIGMAEGEVIETPDDLEKMLN